MGEEKKPKELEVLFQLTEKNSILDRAISILETEFFGIKADFKKALELEAHFSPLEENISHLDEKLRKDLLEKEKRHAQFIKELDGMQVKILSLENDIQELKREMSSNTSSLLESLQRMDTRLSQLNSETLSISQFEMWKTEFEGLVQAWIKRFEAIQKSFPSLSNQVIHLSDALHAHEEYHASLERKMGDAQKSFGDFQKQIAHSLDEVKISLRKEMSSKEKLYNSNLQKALEEMKLTPSSRESLKKEFEEAHGLIKMDASNAVLKATNLEQQFRVMERKIENIFQLLKRHQLND